MCADKNSPRHNQRHSFHDPRVPHPQAGLALTKQPNYSAFLNLIKWRKGVIFHEDDVPKNAGPIHALCLQMLAIVKLNFSNSLVGTCKLEAQNVIDKVEMDSSSK